MPYPDLVWTVLVIAGGLLLLTKKHLTTREEWGVGLIFVGFLFQVYWDILHLPQANALTWNLTSQLQVGYVTLMVVIPLFIWPGFLRKRIFKRNTAKHKNITGEIK